MGTKLHIAVAFLDNFGNENTVLPVSSTVHSKPVCSAFKEVPNGLERCMRCRKYALKRAISKKEPFYRACINGIYEYTFPVVLEGETAAVIMIGNLNGEKTQEKMSRIDGLNTVFGKSLQNGLKEADCEQLAGLLDRTIRQLLKDNPRGIEPGFDPLIENIKKYLEENITSDFMVCELSDIFHYNEKYLGKRFKAKTGLSIREYINHRRIEQAKKCLSLPEAKVTDAALKSGYNSVSYFNRVFRQITGESPSAYKSRLFPAENRGRD